MILLEMTEIKVGVSTNMSSAPKYLRLCSKLLPLMTWWDLCISSGVAPQVRRVLSTYLQDCLGYGV